MFYINELSGEIVMNRGDSGEFTISINQGTALNPISYTFTDQDSLYVAIEEPNQPFENAIIKKKYTTQNALYDENGNFIIKIFPNDTVALMPGLYYYEAKVLLNNENQFRNGFNLFTFNDTEGIKTYTLTNESTCTTISSGTWEVNDGTIILTDDETHEITSATYSDTQIVYNNLIYDVETNIVSTIIPKKRFIIEE